MKKIYLILLMLLILFIPTSVNAVAVYQLDQPIRELNNHTLREVFEEGISVPLTTAYWSGNGGNIINTPNGLLYASSSLAPNRGIYSSVNSLTSGTVYYITIFGDNLKYPNRTGFDANYISSPVVNNRVSAVRTMTSNNIIVFYQQMDNGEQIEYTDFKLIDMTALGIQNLTKEQMDKYYNLYLEAVRFEQENIEASQDIGGYQNIFRSILDGVKGLMTEMAGVWEFLNAPIITSDMQDYSFNIDWSWDIIGVLRQLIGSLAILILQTNFLFINLLFSFTGIPIQISILSMIFSNFVFIVLGWIIVKSFII